MVRKAHAAYFLTQVERGDQDLSSSKYEAWLDQMEQEHDNLRAAMQWSLEQPEARKEIALRLGGGLRPFWYNRGYLSEGLDFLERALAQSDEVVAAVRATALYAAARLYEVRGEYDRAEPLLIKSLSLYRELGDMTRIGYALHLQADIAWRRGNLAMARSQAEESFAIFRQLDDKGAIAGILLHLGALAADQGEYSKALTLLEESLAINRALADKSGTAASLFNLARASYFSGNDLARARILLEESFAIFTELGDKESLVYCLCLSGLLALEQGDTTSAYSLIEQSVTLFKERRQKHGMALSTTSLAKVIAAQGDTTTARVLYEESVLLAMKADDKLNIASALEGLAIIVATQGAYTWAARLWGSAEALRESIGAPLPAVERPAYERAVAAAHAHLGESAFKTVWADGRGMMPEDVLA